MTAENGVTFGTALRRWRQERGLSLRSLEKPALCSKSMLWNLENGTQAPTDDLAARLDEVLDTGGELRELAKHATATPKLHVVQSVPVDPYRYGELATSLLTGEEGADAVHRRTMLAGIGGTSLGMAITPALALEAARHGLTLAAVEEHAAVAIDEWHEIVQEYGYSYMTTPPAELLESLAIDVLAIQRAIERHNNGDPAARELCRCGAFVSAIMAMTVANIGNVRHAYRWWRSARRLADESGDLSAILWIRGREVVRALYEQRSPISILRLVDEAEPIVRSSGSSEPQILSGRAQAQAMAGQTERSLETLHKLQDLYPALPRARTEDRDSLFSWAEDRIRFVESYVYSYAGLIDEASEARKHALNAYSPTYSRGPIQIELQHALALTIRGDIAEGPRHAVRTLANLRPADHIRPVVDFAYRVLNHIPIGQHKHGSAAELREYLSAPLAIEN